MTPETLHATALKRLVKRAQRGDAAAFENLARSCGTTLYRVAASCLAGNEADIADALQETLLAAWRALDTLNEPRYFKTWLVRICINACHQVHRKRRPDVPLEAVSEARLDANLRADGRMDNAMQAAADAEANAAFQQLVTAAGEAYALVITLYYGEGYSAAEIADLLGTTPENVRQRLHRGRQRIARALGEAAPPLQPTSNAQTPQNARLPQLPRAPAGDDPFMQAANPA